MSSPLVSVVMSVYNGEQYLPESIESILIQTYEKFEFIIINDGSTDNSLEVIRDYEEKDKRIVVISRENKGLIDSLNEGIQQSKGKYVVRMDADDICVPLRFEKQVDFMENNPDVGISGSDVLVFGANIKTLIWKVEKGNEAIKSALLFSSPFAHPSIIMNREIIVNNNLFYDNNFLHAEDFELWTRMAKVTKMANIPEVLLKYRVLESSVTRQANKDMEKRYTIHKKIFNTYLQELNLKNSEEENRIHFNISLNKRVKENNIDFKILEKYFNKLLVANKNKKIFDTLEMKSVLGKKWLVNVYYRKKISKIFSKYFLYGLLGLFYKWTR